MVEERWRRAIACDATGLSDRALRVALRGASWPYLAGLKANLALYEWGLMRRRTPSLPTISVGNLTLGGTGKTTTTRQLAWELLRRGLRPGIVLRGHKRQSGDSVLLVSDGKQTLVDPAQSGDEAAMLAQTAPGCLVGVGKRRELVIERLREAGAQIALLDDGFQYFRMARAVDLVLLDATVDLAHEAVFPAGHLREPLAHLRRATHLMITHADLAPAAHVEEIERIARMRCPDAPLMHSRHRPAALHPLGHPGEAVPLDRLAGSEVVAMSALGNPASFEGVLLELGARVAESVAFDDHHAYVPEDWRTLRQVVRTHEAELVVVTEKDAVKLPPPPDGLPPVLALRVELEVTRGSEDWQALVASMAHG